MKYTDPTPFDEAFDLACPAFTFTAQEVRDCCFRVASDDGVAQRLIYYLQGLKNGNSKTTARTYALIDYRTVKKAQDDEEFALMESAAHSIPKGAIQSRLCNDAINGVLGATVFWAKWVDGYNENAVAWSAGWKEAIEAVRNADIPEKYKTEILRSMGAVLEGEE